MFFSSFNSVLIAQKPIIIEDKNIAFRNGTYPGFVISIPEVYVSTVRDAWIKSLERGTKSKVQKEDIELTIFGAINKDITESPINVYSYFKENDTCVQLFVTYELKKDVYITRNTSNVEFNKARAYLMNFAKDQYAGLVKIQLQEEEKKLIKLESELKGLENSKSKLEKTIETDHETIKTLDNDIVIARSNLASLKSELESQRSELEKMVEGSAKDERKKYISDLEKKVSKLENEIKTKENKITDLNSEIEQSKNAIPGNLNEQENMQEKIRKQGAVVASYKNKLNNIMAM
jgi:predicted  nucleic acid-binding Zn-ribbon protein